MPVAITATPGDANANSFVDEADAQAYIDARLNPDAWDGAAVDDQRRALVEATRELDRLRWKGTPVTLTQALAWPREDVTIPDLPDDVTTESQSEYGTDEVPQRIQDATVELALEFLRAGTTDVAGLPSSIELKRRKTGPLEREFFAPHQRARGLSRFPRVVSLIRPLLDPAGVGQKRVVRV